MPQAVFLSAEKEESLVAAVIQLGDPHRTAQSPTEIASARLGPLQASISITGEGQAGVEVFVDQVFVPASVPLIGARLHGHIHDAAARLPELGGVIADLNGPLLDGVGSRLVLLDQALRDGIGRVLAFHQDDFRVSGRAVNANGGVGRVGPRAAIKRTRQQRDDSHGIPNARVASRGTGGQQRKVVHALRSNVVTQLTALRLEQRGRLADGDGLAHIAYVEGDVDAQGLRHL